MEKILFCLVALVAGISCVSAVNCTGKANGVFEKGCRSYAICTDGNSNIVECAIGQVFNNNTKMCDDEANVPPPCGMLIDCSQKSNGRYPDLDQNCHTYYTCTEKKFFGHSFCPSGLVFDSVLGICNWPDNVVPPCGTKSV